MSGISIKNQGIGKVTESTVGDSIPVVPETAQTSLPASEARPLPSKFAPSSGQRPSLFGFNAASFGPGFLDEVGPNAKLTVDLGDAENHPAFEPGCLFTAENKAFLFACLAQRS